MICTYSFNQSTVLRLIYLHEVFTHVYLFRPSEEVIEIHTGPLFTANSVDILKEQLQMHLQLLVQQTVLAGNTPSLQENKDTAIKRIVSLAPFSITLSC